MHVGLQDVGPWPVSNLFSRIHVKKYITGMPTVPYLQWGFRFSSTYT